MHGKDGLLRRARDFMIEYAYGVTLCAMLAMVLGCALYTRALEQERSMQAAADAPEVQASAEPTPEVTPAPTETEAAPVESPTQAPAEEADEEAEKDNAAWIPWAIAAAIVIVAGSAILIVRKKKKK